MDYQGNAKSQKGKGKEKEPAAEKNLGPVVTGEVTVKKKSIGQKIKGVIIQTDFRSVVRYVVGEVLIPAARNTIVESINKGTEKMMYGDKQNRRGSNLGGRVMYNNPIRHAMGGGLASYSPNVRQGPRTAASNLGDIVLEHREDAEEVLDRMTTVLDQFGVVSVADLKELLGVASEHTDQKWGWEYLGSARVHAVREGYLLDLPPEDVIN